MNEEKHFNIYLKGENKTKDIFSFKRIDDRVEITFNNGKSFLYNSDNVRIVESALNVPQSRDCFDYLCRIAKEVGLKVKSFEGKIINILSHNYSKIKFVDPESILGAFISAKFSTYIIVSAGDVIYPFGFNVSQKNAIEKALANQFSIIEGPPGTGKTQTILNIIANLVIRGESVAVVSSNNSATQNVFDKLQKYNVDFIAAYLGNSSNKFDFINAQKPIPDMKNWKLSNDEIVNLKKSLRLKHEILQAKLVQQQNLYALKQELAAIEIEEKHFLRYADGRNFNEYPIIVQHLTTSQKALEMWVVCENYETAPSIRSLFEYIKYIFRYFKFFSRQKLIIRQLLNQYSNDILVTLFQRKFYDLKMSELNCEILKLTRELESFDINAKMNEYTEMSLQILRACLADQYENKKREDYVMEDFRKNSEKFIKDYPVILSTTYSLRSCLANHVMYDYVIIDESSQVDLCTGALALSCAKKAVIVGDLKQLPHVVDSKTANITDAIFAEYELPEIYRYKNQSLLSSLVAMFPNTPRTLLREHYRCHPKIIDFCNKKFYGGELIILTDNETELVPLIVYKTIEGNHERNKINQRQIDVIKNEVFSAHSLNARDGSIGIVTPYRNQTNALQKAFAGMKVKADTVDKFQGQENEVIILSTVDNEISDFTDNVNRLNVAISRAIKQLIVVVSDSDTLKDTNIGDLVRYIEYNNLTVVESKVHSVFDYLYRSYTERRHEFLSQYKSISKYDSENLMYALISSVMKEQKLHHLEVMPHIPLKMIIRDVELLSPTENKYVMNILTHVDFLVFDILSKSPKFAIEVDGVAFHKEGTRQAKRDNMKDVIFKKYNIPLLRFRTDGSGEREQLIEVLKRI
jgi:superfamily I DNA and/or RNA helicase